MDIIESVTELFEKSVITLEEVIELRNHLEDALYTIEHLYGDLDQHRELVFENCIYLDQQLAVMDVLHKTRWPVFFNVTNVEGMLESDNCISIEYAKQKYVFSNVDSNAEQCSRLNK